MKNAQPALACLGTKVFKQQSDRPAAGTFVFTRSPCCSGNIEMRPAVILGEPGQETGRSDRAGGPTANIGHVCKRTVDLRLVFIPQWQSPGAVAAAFACAQQFVSQFVVIAHQTAGV